MKGNYITQDRLLVPLLAEIKEALDNGEKCNKEEVVVDLIQSLHYFGEEVDNVQVLTATFLKFVTRLVNRGVDVGTIGESWGEVLSELVDASISGEVDDDGLGGDDDLH
jgi:hypothetical protein